MSFHNRFGTRNERIKNQRKTLNSSKPKTECSRWDSISRRYWISFFDANGDRSTQVICSSWSGGSFIWKFYADFVVICRRRKQRKIWIHSDSIIKHDSDSAYTILKIKQVWIKKKKHAGYLYSTLLTSMYHFYVSSVGNILVISTIACQTKSAGSFI